MSNYLPDTALAAVSINKDVYTYAQTMNGVLIECQGQLEPQNSIQDIYSFSHQNHVAARYANNNTERANAPKLLTPLAAAAIGSNRASSSLFVFYLDDGNIIRGVKSTRTPWAEETTLSALAVRAAHYSQLTAMTIAENNFQAICLYYQSPRRDAGIEMISLSTKNNTWVKGVPDMTPVPPPPPPPPPRVVDPPLYGTSMTAVRVRKGLEVIPNSKMPVVYLQWDTLSLAHAQESKVETIRSLDLRFAPHTSLAAVDDGTQLYCFYTSSRNNNIKMTVIKDGKASTPIAVETPTPKSSIAAVLPTNDRIVLFYQSLNAEAGTVDLKGMTLRRDNSATTFGPVTNPEPASLA